MRKPFCFSGYYFPSVDFVSATHRATTTVGSSFYDAKPDSARPVHPHLSRGLKQIDRREMLQSDDDQMLAASEGKVQEVIYHLQWLSRTPQEVDAPCQDDKLGYSDRKTSGRALVAREVRHRIGYSI